MNKSINISIKSAIIILSIFTLIIILLVKVVPHLVSLIPSSSTDRIAAYLNVIGNISGGLIAGTVSYLVANHQLTKSKKQDDLKQEKNSYISLLILKNELEYNSIIFTQLHKPEAKSKQLSEIIEFLKQNLQTEQWRNSHFDFVNILNIDTFEKICKIYRNIGFIKQNSSSVNMDFITLTENLIKDTLNIIKNTISSYDVKENNNSVLENFNKKDS